jgi:hypothetical protein
MRSQIRLGENVHRGVAPRRYGIMLDEPDAWQATEVRLYDHRTNATQTPKCRPWDARIYLAASGPLVPTLLAVCVAGARNVTFCTRQFEVSATYSSFSDGHASACAPENCFT